MVEEASSDPGDMDGIIFETNHLWVLKMVVDEKMGSTRARSLISSLSRINQQLDAELIDRGEFPNRKAIIEGGQV